MTDEDGRRSGSVGPFREERVHHYPLERSLKGEGPRERGMSENESWDWAFVSFAQ